MMIFSLSEPVSELSSLLLRSLLLLPLIVFGMIEIGIWVGTTEEERDDPIVELEEACDT